MTTIEVNNLTKTFVTTEDVKKEMNFVLADHVDQVFEAALPDRRGEPGASKGEEGSSDAHKTEG